MTKKILGLNFGRPNGNCKMYLKAALESAKAEGAEVEIIDMMKLKISHCIGCGSCSKKLESGKGQIECCIKDDYQKVSDAVVAADAMIVAAPVYVLAPTGQFKNFLDRFGPSHDIAYMLCENELRKDTGGEVLNPDCLKRHLVSYISVGGATTPHWVSYGLPGMRLFGQSMNMKIVDELDAFGAYVPDIKERLLKECDRMGKHMVQAMDQKTSEITWHSEPGVCPVCHGKEITIYGDSDKVCCPMCGIYGKLTVENGKVRVDFPEEEQAKSRLKFEGMLQHQIDQRRQLRYPKFEEYVEKFRARQRDM